MLRLVTLLTVLATVLVLPLSRAAAQSEMLNIQPGDQLPSEIMELIPHQFREEILLMEFNNAFLMRMLYEQPDINNRNVFDLPRTGINTFYFVSTHSSPPGDVDWVKNNLPTPVYVAPIYSDLPQLSFMPRRLLVFNGRVSMDSPDGWPEAKDVWSGWGGGLRVESIRALTRVVLGTTKGGARLILHDPAKIEFTLSFSAFPHNSTSDGPAQLPSNVEVKLTPRADRFENNTDYMEFLEPFVWTANPGETMKFTVDYPAGTYMPSLWIEHAQNGQQINRTEHVPVQKMAKEQAPQP